MTKHKQYENIIAWANGAEVELHDPEKDTWHYTANPSWYDSLTYRIKPQPMPDIVHEGLVQLSGWSGPMLFASSPSEANVVFVFDGETCKLKECAFKGA